MSYGFRKSRDGNHPGDPPAMWPPMDRTGLTLLITTVIVGLVIGLIIVTSGSDGGPDTSRVSPSARSWEVHAPKVHSPLVGRVHAHPLLPIDTIRPSSR